MQRQPPSGKSSSRGDWTFNVERRGHRVTTAPERAAIASWLATKELESWYGPRIEVSIDDYEILIVTEAAPRPAVEGEAQETVQEAIERLRTETRARRTELGQLAETQFSRKVSWGARGDGATRLFSTTTVPVMTRLHIKQRQVLDLLVSSGVASTRAEALSWCVELVGRHEKEWLDHLRRAASTLQSVREEGPQADRD